MEEGTSFPCTEFLGTKEIQSASIDSEGKMMDGYLTRSQRIVCVIPTLNEAPTIGEVIKGALNYADRIVVVDGNSGDNTVPIAQKSGAEILA